MDQSKVQYIIELLKQGDTKAAVQDLQDLNSQAGKTGEGMKSLGETAKTALATIASALAVRAAIDAFVEYDRAVARLNGTLKATGQDSAEFRGELQAQAKAFSDHSVETEKAIMGVQTLLIQFGAARKDLPQLTQAVLDLSAGMGMDARTAAMELGKAMDGIDGPLKKIGISFDANAGRMEKFGSAVTQVEGRYGGLAKALADSPSGQLTQTQKALEGLTEEFGRLATEALIPALKSINELTVATKAFFETSPLAADLVKQLITIGAVLGTLATTVKGFGMAWELVGGKSISEVGSLKAALESLPKTVPIVIAAAIVADAIYEGILTAQAEHNEKLSAVDLSAQNDRRRSALEKQIAGSGQSDVAKDFMRFRLDTTFGTSRADLGDPTARNLDAETAVLNDVFKQLNPQVPTRLPSGGGAPKPAADGGSLASKLLLDDQKQGLAELDKLTIKLNEESLTGFDKQRQDAEDLFNERADQIDNIARKQSLNDSHREEVDAARLANFNEFSAKVEAINDAQTKQQMDNAAKVQEMKDAFRVEGLDGIDKEIALEDLKYQKQIDHINSLKDLSAPDKTALLGMAGDAHTSAITEIGQKGKEANRDLVDLGQELQHIGQLAQVNFAAGFSNAFLSFIQGTKSAGDAFKQFAADFLEQLAQMILQMLVLKLVQDLIGGGGGGGGILGGLFGGGGGVGGGIGVGTGGGGGESLNLGSMFPSASIGGASRALSSISSMVRTPSLSSLGSAGGGSGMSNPNGEIIFKVALHPAFKAEIVSNSVKGAQAQITHDLEHSTPVRAAAKAILS